MRVHKMTVQRSSAAGQEMLLPTLPVALMEEPSEELRRLGEELKARTDDVLHRTVARTKESGKVLDPLVRDSFERICTVSTSAMAKWMAGEGP